MKQMKRKKMKKRVSRGKSNDDGCWIEDKNVWGSVCWSKMRRVRVTFVRDEIEIVKVPKRGRDEEEEEDDDERRFNWPEWKSMDKWDESDPSMIWKKICRYCGNESWSWAISCGIVRLVKLMKRISVGSCGKMRKGKLSSKSWIWIWSWVEQQNEGFELKLSQAEILIE